MVPWNIILLMVLALLALMALIGVTFATLAGQARITAVNFAQPAFRASTSAP